MSRLVMIEPKPFPEEMKRLRDMLDESGIEWHDASDEQFKNWNISEHASCGYDRIWRTHFSTESREFSVICGYGTYGREFDMLECRIDNNEPFRCLSADDVMRIVNECDFWAATQFPKCYGDIFSGCKDYDCPLSASCIDTKDDAEIYWENN